MTTRPIPDKHKRLRQRQRANGTWRIWWEPETDVRAMGFAPVELDPDKPTWSTRKLKELNADVEMVRAGGSLTQRAPAGGRTMAALITAYRNSNRFKDLKASTRNGYRTNLNVIETKWGQTMVADFSKPIIFEWHEALRNKSGAPYATLIIGMMSILFSFAELKGWRAENSNPCFRLGKKSITRRRRFATWPELDQLLASADTLGMHAMACGIALSVFSSQRQTDVINARLDVEDEHGNVHQAFRDVAYLDVLGAERTALAWEFIRSKRGNYGITPLHPELENRVKSLIGDRTEGFLLIDEETNAPYSGDLFRKRWATIRGHAAKSLPSLTRPGNVLQFRDLRRTFGVMARAGGASKSDVGDLLGNSAGTDPQLGEIYMPPSFHTAVRAVEAIKRPENKEIENGN